MINQQTLEGNWNQVKGQIRQKWGQLTDNDLIEFRGNVDELVGIIQQKTGEGRAAIENVLEQLTESGGAALGNAAETAREYVHQATQSVRGDAVCAADQLNEGIAGAKQLVCDHTYQSLAICFGIGVLVGVVLNQSLRAR